MIEQSILLRHAGKGEDATNLLEKVTTSRLSQHRQKARALLELGRCALAQSNPGAAARHFERCYLSGAKFREFAAPAWLEHGLVLESINQPEEAANVYRALLAKRDFATTPPASRARERLKSLTGGQP